MKTILPRRPGRGGRAEGRGRGSCLVVCSPRRASRRLEHEALLLGRLSRTGCVGGKVRIRRRWRDGARCGEQEKLANREGMARRRMIARGRACSVPQSETCCPTPVAADAGLAIARAGAETGTLGRQRAKGTEVAHCELVGRLP